MISIILPIYNSAPWLRACVESVLSQSTADWELIAIDDGSTDGSGEIMASLAKADSRIRLIRSGHYGPAYGRNLGLAEARGEMVAFIDSDDLWPSLSLETLADIMARSHADISCGEFVRCHDTLHQEAEALRQAAKALEKKEPPFEVMSGIEAVRESLYQRKVNSSLCGKLFRRDLFRNQKLTTGELYEDLDLFYRVAFNAQRVATSALPMYIYRQRSNSIIHTFNPARLDVLEVTRRMHEFIANRHPQLTEAALDRRFSANFNMLQEISRHLAKGSPSAVEAAIFESKLKEIHTFIKANAAAELTNPSVRLKNKAGALLYLTLPKRMLQLILAKS